MLSTVSSRSRNNLLVRLQLESCEQRDVPSATFQSYGGWAVYAPPVSPGVHLGTPVPGGSASVPGAPLATQGLVVTQVITPIDTNNDLSSYEKATFKVRNVSGAAETVSFLVFKKDESLPFGSDPTAYKNAQTLLSYQSVNLQNGAEATLTVNLPACDYQLDATVVPLGTLDLGTPIGFDTALKKQPGRGHRQQRLPGRRRTHTRVLEEPPGRMGHE